MSENLDPLVTVDVALFTINEGRLCVLLARRAERRPDGDADYPFPGVLALPGGYVRTEGDDNADASARRVLRDKAGLSAPHLEQLYTFSGRFRDPRRWSMSVAYYAVVPAAELVGNDLCLVPVDDLPPLPFDHADIIAMAVRRLRGKSSYSTLPMFLLPEKFTFDELLAVYQQVMGVALNRVTFRRRMEAQGVVVAVEGEMRIGAHRPAQLFRAADDVLREFDETF